MIEAMISIIAIALAVGAATVWVAWMDYRQHIKDRLNFWGYE